MPTHSTADRREAALDALQHRVDDILTSIGDEFPFFADPSTGEWETTPGGDWCAGHWIGLLWVLSEHATRPEAVERFSTAAREYTDRYLAEGDVSWMSAGMSFFHGGFQSYDVTGNCIPYGLGFMSADAMTDLFDECARQILSMTSTSKARKRSSGSAKIAMSPGGPSRLSTTSTSHCPSCGGCTKKRAISHADRHLD